MKVFAKIELEHKVLIINGEEKDSMKISIKTERGKMYFPIIPPVRVQNRKKNIAIVGGKIKGWTKKELQEILSDEIEKFLIN